MTRLGGERGAVMIIATFFLAFALLPLLVFVIDVGNWWVHKRHLQLQVDAAALAGGDLFGKCFSNNGGPSPTANSDMQAEANKYGGVTSGSYNTQIGGANQGFFPALRFNQQTWANGEVDPEYGTSAFPATADACTSDVFDVKATESNLPLFFRNIVGFSFVPAINRRARVALFQVRSGNPRLPLAVPDITPKDVAVTFFVYSGGIDQPLPSCPNSCVFHLTKGANQNGLSAWTGSATITVPNATTDIGLRVGLGSAVGSCAGVADAANGQYECYDNDGTTPLVLVRGYPSSPPSPKPTTPVETAVWEQTSGCGVNTGSPFFSDGSGQGSCTAFVQAQVNFGQSPSSIGATVAANGQQMTYNGNNLWLTSFSYPVAAGAEPVVLSWQVTNYAAGGCTSKKPCKSPSPAFPPSPDQQAYSADSDFENTGPVKVVTLSEASQAQGSPYSLAPGSHTLSIEVDLSGSLAALPVPSPTILLRFFLNRNHSRSTAVQCDPGGNTAYTNSLANGCQTPYQINPTDTCNPDPAPPGSADCVPTRNGDLGSTVGRALNTRYASCPANNWPDYTTNLSDPRILQLMITDFSNLLGSGGTLVPVTNYASFYLTGWDGQTCANNEPPPVPVKQNSGVIWGHFIKYVNPKDVGSQTSCSTPGNNVIPCFPELVR